MEKIILDEKKSNTNLDKMISYVNEKLLKLKKLIIYKISFQFIS